MNYRADNINFSLSRERVLCGVGPTTLFYFLKYNNNSDTNINEIHSLLKIAFEKYQDDDGYVNVSFAGTFIKRTKPDFDLRSYGYLKLPDLIEAYPDKNINRLNSTQC